MPRIAVRQAPQPEAAPLPLGAFRVVYEAGNESPDRTEGHWDHVAIHDGDDLPCYENWLTHEALDPGQGYCAVFDVPGLAAGAYRVLLTVDGGSDDPFVTEHPLEIAATVAS